MAVLKSHNGYYLWKYLPSLPVSIVFCLLFVLVTAAVTWRMVKTKTWYVTVFVIGGLFEIIGIAIRAYCLEHTEKLIPYILQSVFILLAPALFAASIYMVLGRLIRRVKAEAYSFIRVKWLTKFFVTFDVLSFFIQGSGAGLMANAENAKTGEGIVVGGLFVQIIAFGVFIAVMVIFQKRMRANPTLESQDPTSTWKRDVNTLYLASVLIMVRSIFRVIEFIMGNDGYLLSTEWPLYVFDIVLMLIMMVFFFINYPGYPSLLSGFGSSSEEDKRGIQLESRG